MSKQPTSDKDEWISGDSNVKKNVQRNAQKADESGRAESFSELSEQDDPGLVVEFVEFLKYNKKWWLTPIFIVTLLLIGAAILLPSPVAPFIYTLF